MNAVYSSTETNQVYVVKAWKLPFFLIYNKIWNLLRRPLVKMWQREVIQLAAQLKQRLAFELLPTVYSQRHDCPECAFLYSFLKGQPFTSQIEQALLHSPCSKHHESYRAFYIQHEALFIRSHQLSDQICGFRSLRK